LVFFVYIAAATLGFHLPVALATVYGRYHYAADAVARALVGIAGFIASNLVGHRTME
jgi:hypothetical protein